ncbi:MAG: enoyl-CoA hydratase-related protein [Rhodospirillales bacterium]
MFEFETITYKVEDRIAWVKLNRPKTRNAISMQMRVELYKAFTDFKDNDDAWVAIFTGEDPSFCSGKDLFEKAASQDGDVISSRGLAVYMQNIYKPIICALNGPCLAQGAGLALNGDIIIMSENASIGWPQVKRGISSTSGPSFGAHMFPTYTRAMGYLLRGVFASAQECYQYGIANEVVKHEDLIPTAVRYANEIMECAPMAVRSIKRATREGWDKPAAERADIARAIGKECRESEDAKEGIQAFKEKRKPIWKGR